MARDHARLIITIWNDPDWRALSGDAQRLYMLLLSQEDLSYCGLVPMRLRRWASMCSTTSVDTITTALAELHDSRFALADHDTEEVLVRSLVRNDGIWKQPNTLAAAIRESFAISSPILRAAVAAELHRLPARCGAAPGLAAAALVDGVGTMPSEVKAACAPSRRRDTGTASTASVEPDSAPDTQSRPTPAPLVVETLGKGSGTPSRIPSEIPSALGQGEGGRGKGFVVPVSLSETQVQGVAPAHEGVRTREDAARLVAELVPNLPRTVVSRLVGQVSGLLGEGIAAEHVVTGLRTWAGKRLGVGLLPELVAEAMRAPVIAQAAGRSRSDDAVAAAMELVRRMAIEDGEIGEHDPAPQHLAAVLGVASGRGDVPKGGSGSFVGAPALAGVA
ncbi:hypothetical protein ACFFQW_49185 [Umezawaea endophytica]|uniref:Uncharacterized protein n=1 Tax=Umezawaea endophytica TaxID=1654476 RepID=A0A9X3ALM2_9PSEU|nr:hypothetical protein [Umezawaea endophytica]MCS7484680.1 hypothetical protein [Umezawaea endophytica]